MSNQTERSNNDRELLNEPTLIDLEGMEEEINDSEGLLDNDVNNWRGGNPSRVSSRPSDQSGSKFSLLIIFIVGIISLIAVLVFSYRLYSPQDLEPNIKYFAIFKQTWPKTLCKTTKCIPNTQ